MRAQITGNPNTPLHAADLEQTRENLTAVSEFFQERSFARLGVIATKETRFHVDMHNMAAVTAMLKQQVARVAALTPCSAVALIFEQSQRGDPLLMQHFGTLALEENGNPIPTEHCIMPKRTAEPGLEVADFVVNASGSQARRQLRGRSGFALDYQKVFHQLPLPYGQFCLITDVHRSADDARVTVTALRPNT